MECVRILMVQEHQQQKIVVGFPSLWRGQALEWDTVILILNFLENCHESYICGSERIPRIF
jgi:hypothetical protein